jgi:hypothetical protein
MHDEIGRHPEERSDDRQEKQILRSRRSLRVTIKRRFPE